MLFSITEVRSGYLVNLFLAAYSDDPITPIGILFFLYFFKMINIVQVHLNSVCYVWYNRVEDVSKRWKKWEG